MNKLLEIKKIFRTTKEVNEDHEKQQQIYKKEQSRISNIKKLSINQIKNLTESYIKELNINEWMAFSKDQFKELNKDLIKYAPFKSFGFSNKFFETLNKEKLLSIPLPYHQ
jgi:hypothetical protein